MIQFDLPKQKSSIIKVLGVGGGGSNAVNFMFKQDIEGVDFIICNTDSKAIEQSAVPNKIQLGPHLTQGLGAGADPSVGKLATEESLDEIKKILEVNTKMAFITVGMGGGTGTGGAPIIAKICKDLGILTVGIVTTPFGFEGPRRQKQAEEGINQLKPLVDTLLVISNDKLRVQYGNLKMKEAFTKADNVLATAAKCITDVINSRGHIIVDFADVCTVMKNGGVAILGKAEVEGENRALRAIEEALNSPLLNDNDIKGAKWILLNINSAEGEFECSMDELEVINNILRERTGEHSDVIMGMGYDETLGEKLGITLIATGFEHKDPFKKEEPKKAEAPVEEKIVMTLVTEEPAKPAPVVEVAAGNQIQDEFEVPAEDNHFILEMEQEAPEEIAVFTVAAAEMMETMQEEAIVEEEEMEEEEMEEEEMEEETSTIEFDLAPTLMEEEVDYASVYVSAPEEEVIEEAVEETIVETIITAEVETAQDVHIDSVEEEAPAFFELTIEETAFETPTEFILNKPTNIYVEDSMESAIEAPVENVMEEEALEEAATTEEALIEEEVFEAPIFEASSFEEAVNEEALFEEEVAPVVFETSFRTVTPSNEDAFVTPSQMAVAEDNQDMQLVLREDNVASNKPNHQNYDMPIDDTEEQRRKVAERIQKLRNLSFNINNSSDPNNEFDAVPAYVRRNLDLFGNTMASVENYYSKYTVEKDENNQTQISTINSFLDGKKPD